MQKIERGGLQFIIRADSSDVKAIDEVVTRHGYEKRDFKIDGGEWLDLGANVGAFTCLAASRGAHVIAVEPEPETVHLLKQNVALNKLTAMVEIVEGAAVLGDSGVANLFVNSANRNYWRSSLVKPWRGGRRVPVRTVSIRELLREGQQCKMDIEGGEMALLEGCEHWWSRLVYEWSFDIDPSIVRFKAVRDRMRSMYADVRYGAFDESLDRWPASWFPACRTVWCH